MFLFYNIIIHLVGFLLKIISFFNRKINLFVNGRTSIFDDLAAQCAPNDDVVWFHCASLGEFEQGRPIIERFRSSYPQYKIVITFFSPSGYEIRKDFTGADLVTYLPLDTRKNAQRFIEIVNPEFAIFIKYEFWPNILKELKANSIKTMLISGIFRKDQPFFKWYGRWMRRSLQTFDHFFVQNKGSKELLKKIGFENITISGDTRFDRVFEITKQDNHIDFLERFCHNKQTLVAGSTWPKDEELLVDYINHHAANDQKFIIAPHNIDAINIKKLKNSITKSTMLFSEVKNTADPQVLIIDSIGLLTTIYRYANIAYVGGGFGVGIHNILEPAAFGVPVLIGPNFRKFMEAKELVELEACIVINNSSQLNTELKKLFKDHNFRRKKGAVSAAYILNNKGATEKIFSYIREVIEVK